MLAQSMTEKPIFLQQEKHILQKGAQRKANPQLPGQCHRFAAIQEGKMEPVYPAPYESFT